MPAENNPLMTPGLPAGALPHVGSEVAPRPAPGMWDLDELEHGPPPPLSVRVKRALGVAAVWTIAILPVATGWQRCAVAALLHRPCPGCGMTRAILLLAGGHVDASLRMHALAVPVALMGVVFIASTIWTTLTVGTPLSLYKGRLGRWTVAGLAVVYGAAFVLWIARGFGLFGGPVPVY
jgi:hypothetical protein